MTVLVTGATGRVGREVVRALLERGADVRALTRDPSGASFDPRVEVVRGDLLDLTTVDAALNGVEAVHLITFDGPHGGGGGEPLQQADQIVDLLRSHGVARISVLQAGMPGPVENAVMASGLTATLLQPVEFMANAVEWAEPIRRDGGIAEAYVDRLSAMVHEGDIGDVAAVALTEDGHGGQTWVVSGPEVLTLRDKLDAIGAAVGRDLELVELTVDEAVGRWQAAGYDADTIGFLQWVYGNPPEVGYTVSDTVPRVTGKPGRTFAQWAVEHADVFR